MRIVRLMRNLTIVLGLALTGCLPPRSTAFTPTATHTVLPAAIDAITPLPAATATRHPTTTATPPPTPTLVPLSDRPQVWFAPLPPMGVYPGRPFTGSEDFMALFDPDAPWQSAAQQIHVFKLYQEWVEHNATDAQLQQAIADLNRRGIAIGLEAAPFNAAACGQNVEGFAGVDNALGAMRRIKEAGGNLRVIGMDEPFYYAHIYDGPNACHWEPKKIAREVHQFIEAARSIFPNVIVGDTEPITDKSGAAEYQLWLDTFRKVNGYDLPFVHLDMSYDLPDWIEQVQALYDYGRRHNIEIGIIYMGNWDDPTDEAWLIKAGERAKKLELRAGLQLDHILFQSWNDHPDFILPESEPYTWAGFIATYFEDKAALGSPRTGPGANLAYEKPVQASSVLPEFPPAWVVDGETGTVWNSGGGAPQWIEVDLGAPHTIAEIRLHVSQYPAGETVHRVLSKGPDEDNAYVLLHTFSGLTQDPHILTYTPPTPWQNVRWVRVETTASPSWVAWREIEVIAAE